MSELVASPTVTSLLKEDLHASLSAPVLDTMNFLNEITFRYPEAISFAPGGRFGSWQPWVAMGAAKAAMEVLGRYFAVALASRGITVNTISPGWVEDSVLNSLPEAFQTGLREWQERGWTPMGRLGTPSDVGNAVAMICSEEADWITGQLIDVDVGAALVDGHLPLEFQGMAKPKAAGAK